jgi:AcrR family transcriptional regulator
MLDAAVAVFAASGFHAASMDEIAARAGVSKPMVYAYLGTKDDLFLACLHREVTALVQALVAAVEPDLPPDEQLWRGLTAFFGYVAEHRDGWIVLHRRGRPQPRFAAELRGMRERMVEVVSGLLTRAVQAAGHTPRPAELTTMAYALVGAGESLADRLTERPHEAPETAATQLMNVVWLGAADLLRGATWKPPA